MIVTNIRVGVTKNLGNYESAKLEIEAIPSEGQTAEEALTQVKEYVEANVAQSNGNGESKPAKAKSDPPLKGKAAAPPTSAYPGPCTDPTSAGASPKTGSTLTKNTKPPATANGKAKPKGKSEHEKELRYALDSETLEELLERFNNVRKVAGKFGDKWEDAVTKVADRYRKLNTLDADPAVLDQLVKAFKSERQAIDQQRSELVEA